MSRPLIDDRESLLRAERPKLSRSSDLAKAMDYTLKRWPAFTSFLDDGRVCLSKNATERNLRGIVLGRKSWLFDSVPDTPRIRQKDNPRSFFRFAPLVPPDRDEFEALLAGAKQLARERVSVRGVEATEELYDLIVFAVSSFVRPTTTELYALKHNDITIETEPKRLLVTVHNGKSGLRVTNMMPEAVTAYERIQTRYPDVGGEDYVFLPGYPNRATAARMIQRQFNLMMERRGLKHDPVTNTNRTIYCLRHTAICMTIIRSRGQVNIYNLAKNLQSFGEG